MFNEMLEKGLNDLEVIALKSILNERLEQIESKKDKEILRSILKKIS